MMPSLVRLDNKTRSGRAKVSGFGLMFLYSQYSLHAERIGLRSFGLADLYRYRPGTELGSPFTLGGRCKSKQKSFSLPHCSHCLSDSWDGVGTSLGENLTSSLRRQSAEAKGVLL